MEEISQKILEEIIRNYRGIRRDLKKIKKPLRKGREKERRTTEELINEFFTQVNYEGGKMEYSFNPAEHKKRRSKALPPDTKSNPENK